VAKGSTDRQLQAHHRCLQHEPAGFACCALLDHLCLFDERTNTAWTPSRTQRPTKMSKESNNCETACTFATPSAHGLASSHSAARPPPPPLPAFAHGVALAFPLAGPMGTRLHAAVTALIQHQQYPHLRDVVLKATSQRLAGSHGAQRGFFVLRRTLRKSHS